MLARPELPSSERSAMPAGALALHAEIAGQRLKTLYTTEWGPCALAVELGQESVWLIIRRKGHGGLALRTAYAPAGLEAEVARSQARECTVTTKSALGAHQVDITLTDQGCLRVTTTLTPAADLLIPYLPRDLYPLADNDSPLEAKGTVEAAQRGVNAGLLYFCMRAPAFGNVLYFQNLTALNGYFDATQTTPDGVVGGQWPELGFQPPTMLGNSPPTQALKRGKAVILSDVHLSIRLECETGEQASALMFLEMLADVYRGLDKPATDFRDWPRRAKMTLRDLERSSKASIEHYGHTYLHPYVAAEYPDSMVQLSVLTAIHAYAKWSGRTIPLEAQLAAGLNKFFDPKLGVVRRYLPNVGSDKNRFAVDSWYLYHPLTNLGRLAKDGDETAARLFMGSLDYAVEAARRFKYRWPIQYDVRDFKVITPSRNDAGLGQTDVGGIYAYLMVQAFEHTGRKRFLGEAERALRAAEGLRFEMAYQANLTAWGAVAALKMWRLTGETWFRRQSHVYLAGLFHNSEIWESQINTARHFRNFLGLTCLHDAPYMALFECFESFAALAEYLDIAEGDIEPGLQLLISEYNRYGLDRAWFYYPDALPAEVLAKEVRNGHIDPKLSFPLEDLYGDGQPCGQVGQEIYGCGAAFVYASRAFHRWPGAPFLLFCDRRVRQISAMPDRGLSVVVDSPTGCNPRLVVRRKGRSHLATVKVETAYGPCHPLIETDDRLEFEAPVDSGAVTVTW